MTLTQVSTWFANARRRLKKENKWSPDAGFEDDEEKGKYFKIKGSSFSIDNYGLQKFCMTNSKNQIQEPHWLK